jgi:RHS repeat-associated protein
MISTTDRDNRTRTFTYDADNRLVGQTWYDSSHNVVNTLSYTYDAAGNRLTASDNNSTYTYTYDALDRVITVQEPFGLSLSYTYDAAGHKTSVVDSIGGTTTYVYDAANRLVSLQFGGTGQTPLRMDMTYTARNELAGESRYSDLAGTHRVGKSTYTYDAAGRLIDLVQKDGAGTSLAAYAYAYDAAGNLTSETLNGGTPTTYTYDATNQLLSDSTTSYSYDANGNRTNSGYATGPANELTTDGTWNYFYDNEGNLTKKTKIATGETWTYTYDNLNHLVQAQDRVTDGGTIIQTVGYKYDVLGNRIEEDVTAGMTTTISRFAYDGSNAWADLDASNFVTTRRLYLDAIDAIVARIATTGGVAAWYLTDRLGSVRDITGATGAVQDTITYDGYGNVLTETNASFGDRYKFTAREFDSATGLQYNRARFYDPTIGRWTSQDPLGFGAGDANLYRYVGNRPTRQTDPTGLNSLALATQNVIIGYTALQLLLGPRYPKVALLIKDLDDDKFAVRQAASNMLEAYLADKTDPYKSLLTRVSLELALLGCPPLEQRRRIERLLQGHQKSIRDWAEQLAKPLSKLDDKGFPDLKVQQQGVKDFIKAIEGTKSVEHKEQLIALLESVVANGGVIDLTRNTEFNAVDTRNNVRKILDVVRPLEGKQPRKLEPR